MADRGSKSAADARRFIAAVSNHHGWKTNPDLQFVDVLARGLSTNFNRYGFYQCPCRDSWGDSAKDEDIVCPCVYCEPDLAEYGHCYCGLFLTEERARSGKAVVSIPERRPTARFP